LSEGCGGCEEKEQASHGRDCLRNWGHWELIFLENLTRRSLTQGSQRGTG
jgi:hypothetical protein